MPIFRIVRRAEYRAFIRAILCKGKIRPDPDLNRGMTVLQTVALPLGDRAVRVSSLPESGNKIKMGSFIFL